MSLLFETIRLEDGVFMNLGYHNFRLNKSREFHFETPDQLNLEKILIVPSNCRSGIYKCKVSYSSSINEIEIIPYRKRIIRSLRLVEDNTISYDHKYTERAHLLELMAVRGDCDDILILKNGFITDTSFTNVVFWDGAKWLTPASPLLRGTMRESLLNQNLIVEENITLDDLSKYYEIRLINAMLPLESGTGNRNTNIYIQR